MPQMGPLPWLSLYILVLSLMFIYISSFYFLTLPRASFAKGLGYIGVKNDNKSIFGIWPFL